jgi:hypothetical protein
VEPLEVQRPKANGAAWIPSSSSSEASRSSDVESASAFEKRWRILQKIGVLAELPTNIENLKSSWVGNGLPRTLRLSFLAPREAVKKWLEDSPGYQSPQKFQSNLAGLEVSYTRIARDVVVKNQQSDTGRDGARMVADWMNAKSKLQSTLDNLQSFNGPTSVLTGEPFVGTRYFKGATATFIDEPSAVTTRKDSRLVNVRPLDEPFLRSKSCHVTVSAKDAETVEVTIIGTLPYPTF